MIYLSVMNTMCFFTRKNHIQSIRKLLLLENLPFNALSKRQLKNRKLINITSINNEKTHSNTNTGN